MTSGMDGAPLDDGHRAGPGMRGRPRDVMVADARGRTPADVQAMVRSLLERHDRIFVGGATAEHYALLLEVDPSAEFGETAGVVGIDQARGADRRSSPHLIVILAAGTSDLPVADAASFALTSLGHSTKGIYDVGVAGLHRLLASAQEVGEASCLIVVAGMDGALPGVAAALADCPVIAVPTSRGYGASLGGIAALLSMTEACRNGLSVVGIDDGLAAALVAHRIVTAIARPHLNPGLSLDGIASIDSQSGGRE